MFFRTADITFPEQVINDLRKELHKQKNNQKNTETETDIALLKKILYIEDITNDEKITLLKKFIK